MRERERERERERVIERADGFFGSEERREQIRKREGRERREDK